MSKLNKCEIDNEIYYYFLKNGEKRYMYRHKYYDVLDKRREKKSSGFETEKEAYRSLLEVKASLLNGDAKQIENSHMTVSQLLDIWLTTKKHSWKPTTVENNRIVVKNHLKPLIGHYKLLRLTPATYEREFINKQFKNGAHAGSIRQYHGVFKMAINFAVDEDIIPRNKFNRIKIDSNEQLENYLSPAELNLFLGNAKEIGNNTQWILTLVLAYSGMRKGEALALKWSNVDFVNNTVTIEATRYRDNIRSPKTKNSYRTIELDKTVMHQLANYRKWCKEVKFSYGIKDKDSDLVFIKEDAEPVYDHYINAFFRKLYNSVNADGEKLKVITPHGLRHTHATILIDALIPPTDIAKRLGNTLEMIYNVYAHSFEKVGNKTVSAFTKSINGAKTGAN